MSAEGILKSLGRETKALIIVSEFEARRMPMFQMRVVLNELATNAEEKKVIVDLVENDLKATGYHPNQITAFLQDLLNETPEPTKEVNLRATRRLRSPFAHGFEAQAPEASMPGTPPALAPSPGGSGVAGKVALRTPFMAQPGTTLEPAHLPGRLPNLKLPLQPPRAAGLPPPKALVLPKVPFTPAPPQADKGAATPATDTRPGGTPGPTVKESVFFGGSLSNLHVESKPTILLADDDKRIRIVFRLCLERIGYRVVEAEDGNEAWKKIQEGGLIMACLDMKMPGLHGLEVLTRIANKQIDLPVVICSAYDQLKDEFVVASYPKLRYLVKPVAAEALEKAVKELLGAPAP